MPEFDTYRCIERYAKNPLDSQAQAAFRFLLRRAQVRAGAQALTIGSASTFDISRKLAIGALTEETVVDKADTLTAQDIIQKPLEEQYKLFSEMCKSAGVDFDLSTLIKDKQEKTHTNG